jgi:hypothetical protein
VAYNSFEANARIHVWRPYIDDDGKPMSSFEAIYDGSVLRPVEPLGLPANTHVRITLEVMAPPAEKANSFLAVASTLNLQGPPDWATNFEEYMYGQAPPNGD